jgi:hypothetical protein
LEAISLLFFVCLYYSSAAHAAPQIDASQQQIIAKTVKEFCEFEFNGSEDTGRRKELIHFSNDTLKKLSRAAAPMDPYLFMFESDPMDIVDSFEIIKVETTNSKAIASVKYSLVAKRQATAGSVRKVEKSDSIVKLELALVDGYWKVIDPPPPRVSRRYVSQAYRQKFMISHDWYKSASAGQWRELRKYIDIILLLDE